MIFYGVRASKIGAITAKNSTCEYCFDNEEHRISVFGKYFHIFWIPVFPVGKVATAECTKCLKTVEQKEFSKEIKDQYQSKIGEVKRPKTHWIGLMLIGLFAAFISYIVATAEVDPRSELLKADISRTIQNPTMETDSISFKIKNMFDILATEEVSPEDFRYLTEVKEDKALILVKFPSLKTVEKESRASIIDMIEMVTQNMESIKGKEVYIGVSGSYSIMLFKTPVDYGNGLYIDDGPLLEYYGEKVLSED